MSRRLFLLLLALALTACATAEESLDWSEGDEAQIGSPGDALAEKIINGRLTFDFPAAGMLRTATGLCTATLVRPTVVLTAAHCVDYASADRPGQRLAQFIVEHGQSQRYAFDVDGMVSYARVGPGTDDIALLRLTDAVPANIATPVPFADRRPQAGEAVTWYGYGCQNRAGRDQFTGQKQKIAFAFQNSNNSCPGDSGGPTVFGADGAVFRVTSGYSSRGDIFGDVIAMRGTLEAQANAWSSSNGAGNGGAGNGGAQVDPPDVNPPAGGRPTVRRTLIQDGWLFVEWTRVASASNYLQFLVAEGSDGQVAAWLYRGGPGDTAGPDSLYGYFGASRLCSAIRDQGRPAGVYQLWTQIWPDRDDSRAESARFGQSIRCQF